MKTDNPSEFPHRRLFSLPGPFHLAVLGLLALAITASAQGLRPTYDLKNLPGSAANAPDILAYGATALDSFGRTVRTGDINGDGVADVIIGVQGADPGTPVRAESGAVLVWFGKVALAGVKDASGVAGTAPDLVIWGASASDQLTAGGALRVADINGDGIADLLIGSSGGDGPAEARNNAGEAFIVFGRKAFPPVLDLAIQGGGGADVTIYGPSNDDSLTNGGAMAIADVNGDGLPDILLGAPLADGPAEAKGSAGEAYVVLGRAAFPTTMDLAVQGSGGADATIYGATANDFLTLGGSLITGDLNGDGIADIVLGASGGDGPAEARSSAGDAYIVFGRATFPTTLNLDVQGNSGASVTIWGATANDQLTSSGNFGIADLDGDGIVDLVLGASGGDGPAEARSGAGEAYVVRGRTAFPATLDLAIGGSAGADLTIYGATASDNLTSGGTLAFGDLNRDGITDLVLGAPLADGPLETRSSAGEAYIIFGRTALPAILDLAIQGTGGADVTIYGATGGDNLSIGRTLAVADMNGDGFTDLILGSPLGDGPAEARANAGEAYIVRGRSIFPAVLDLGLTGIAGANVTLWGASANDQITSGGAIAAGDLNGDGLPDLVIGVSNGDGPDENRTNAGEVYVLYGVAVPEIDVAQPVGADLADGGSRSFGTFATGRTRQLSFTIKNSGAAKLTGLGLTIDGADAASFSVISSPAAPLAPGASTTFSIAATSPTEGVKTAVIHIASNDEDEPLFAINVTADIVTPVPPVVVTLDAEIVGDTDATLNATVNAVGSERAVVFEYGTDLNYGATVSAVPSVVDGVTDIHVQLPLTGLARRTVYHFRASADGDMGSAAGQDMTFMTPNHNPVCSPDALKTLPGTTGVIDVLANDTDPDGDALTIASYTPLAPATAGQVSWNGGAFVFTPSSTFTTATFSYTVDDGYGGSATAPVILTRGSCSLDPSAATLTGAGGAYAVIVTADCPWQVNNSASWITVTPASGSGNGSVLITVAPQTVHQNRTATVTIGGQPHQVTEWSPWRITPGQPLSPGLVTTYHGLIERHPLLNDSLGSRMELITTASATFSGKIISGKFTATFTGKFVPDADLMQWRALASVTGGGDSPRVLDLDLHPDDSSLTGTLAYANPNVKANEHARENEHGEDLEDDHDDQGKGHGACKTSTAAAAVAWRSTAAPWDYAAGYAFNLAQPNPSTALPQGSGQGSFVVNSGTSALMITGTLSDRSVFTGSTFVGPRGQVLIYQPLYSSSGSLTGTLTITPGATAAGNAITGSPTWYASEDIPASKKTSYRPAFGPLPLTATGGTVPTR